MEIKNAENRAIVLEIAVSIEDMLSLYVWQASPTAKFKSKLRARSFVLLGKVVQLITWATPKV